MQEKTHSHVRGAVAHRLEQFGSRGTSWRRGQMIPSDGSLASRFGVSRRHSFGEGPS